MNFSKNIVLPFAELMVFEENIICIKVTRAGEVDETMAVQLVQAVVQLANNKRHALLYDLNNQNIMLSSLAKNIAGPRSYEKDGLFARALVVYNLSNKLEMNHFLKYSKPATPTEIFSNFTDAITWIKSIEFGA